MSVRVVINDDPPEIQQNDLSILVDGKVMARETLLFLLKHSRSAAKYNIIYVRVNQFLILKYMLIKIIYLIQRILIIIFA